MGEALASHEASNETNAGASDGVEEANSEASDDSGAVHCKFEPFVLHVQSRNLERAQQMMKVALASGYRNSGMMIGKKKKFMTAVRSTYGMEVPLSFNKNTKVTEEYIKHLTVMLNSKMDANFLQIQKFFDELRKELSSTAS